ncbi:MAG: endonuclease/exonuclease/phosphatase family protein [Bacteroidales bacterium]|nr:endonuclease/exonuclease/phosphatase family protein [Bacteroidales bacterium]
MKFLKLIFKIFLLIVICIVLFIIYSSIFDYKPKSQQTIYKSDYPDSIEISKNYDLMIWNIGYCGLSADMDFFYDGGEQVRTSKENVLTNLKFIKSILKKNDSLDFILLQEVDINSKRSYHINELECFKLNLPCFRGFFGKNYDVKFVPSPIIKPLGKVKSGLLSMSRSNPKSVTRYSFPGNYSWPVRLFMSDRCFLVKRFATKNKKEFILINTHYSAYDDGTLKKQQMDYLKKFIIEEYEKGNYVIVGGDWNQNPPDVDYSEIKENSPTKRFVLNPINKDYLPKDWTWVYDPSTPTNRYLNAPYEKGKTITPIIDFYLMSPNIKCQFVKTIDFDFLNTDHQPIMYSFNLE